LFHVYIPISHCLSSEDKPYPCQSIITRSTLHSWLG
jgi:hypothetical protein